MNFDHPKFGKLQVRELTQRDLEDFSRASRDGKAGELLKIEYDGFMVRRAVHQGFITEPRMTVDEIDGFMPARVRWMASCLADALADALAVDPLSSSPSQTS